MSGESDSTFSLRSADGACGAGPAARTTRRFLIEALLLAAMLVYSGVLWIWGAGRADIHNAMEAMPRGGRLTVSFELRGGFVSFSVADTGVGIDKADLPKVFLPFYSTKAKGLGLGLNIARRTIEANGGSLELKSARGKGTKVTVTLPIALETPR